MIKLLTTKEAASLLNISPGTLRVWRCQGKHHLPYIKIGSRVRYPETAILNFIEENTYPQECNVH